MGDDSTPVWLVSGDNVHLIDHLDATAEIAEKLDIGVAFISEAGIRHIESIVKKLLDRRAPVRILCSDYLSFSKPAAFRKLLELQSLGASIRVFETEGKAFHMKAYIFQTKDEDGVAFIGSSNMTGGALTHNIEWNVRVEQSENNGRFHEINNKFVALFRHQETVNLTKAWIDLYQERYIPLVRPTWPLNSANQSPISPNRIQQEALAELKANRQLGISRGLVVMATGLGKTWLSAFDAQQMKAEKILFVAHRDTILEQAERTFEIIFDTKTIGRYSGKEKSLDADILFASVGTIGKLPHLEKFAPDTFDYIVVDEFHHAAAMTYRKILNHFKPKFLLGLTATPDRTDQANILSYCDDNEIYRKDLLDAIRLDALCPFIYYGIADKFIDYNQLKWTGSRFNLDDLENAVVDDRRALQAFEEWNAKKQKTTIAFCVRKKHADYMAEFFKKRSVRAASIHSESEMTRKEAIHSLEDGSLEIIFTVDLFSEGVDVPVVDTVLLLRPTESKIVFLQQIGRGLRKSIATGKKKLHIIDFIGNHRSFLKKPEALFGLDPTNASFKTHVEQVKAGTIDLPPGCQVEYDLEVIDFINDLIKTRTTDLIDTYKALKDRFPPRPTAAEAHRGGILFSKIRDEWGSWFSFLIFMGDLSKEHSDCYERNKSFFDEVEKTSMTKSFKIVTLEALNESGGFLAPPTVAELAELSLGVIVRRKKLWGDVAQDLQPVAKIHENNPKKWIKYWRENPVNAWIGGNKSEKGVNFFELNDDRFVCKNKPLVDEVESHKELLHELIDLRYFQYEPRALKAIPVEESEVVSTAGTSRVKVPYFPNLKIACGHFREGSSSDSESIEIFDTHGTISDKHIVCRAKGNSMDGGKMPVKDGDYLLLEMITGANAGTLQDQIVAVSTINDTGHEEYLLRKVTKKNGQYILVANNPSYSEITAGENISQFARLKAILPPEEVQLHRRFLRDEIPQLFQMEFNTGKWNPGHITGENHSNKQFLLVTLNKKTKSPEHRYSDFFESPGIFHWQSQNSTKPASKKGQKLRTHVADHCKIHLFVRKNAKGAGSKAEPFAYCGLINFVSWEGSKPINVKFELVEPLNEELVLEFLD